MPDDDTIDPVTDIDPAELIKLADALDAHVAGYRRNPNSIRRPQGKRETVFEIEHHERRFEIELVGDPPWVLVALKILARRPAGDWGHSPASCFTVPLRTYPVIVRGFALVLARVSSVLIAASRVPGREARR